MKQLVISRDSLETRVALLEEGRLAELYLERPGQASLVGNIYKGRVENVLAGMDAAFVDIGLERNGFLYVDEVTTAGGAGGAAAQDHQPAPGRQGGVGAGDPRRHGEQGPSPHHPGGPRRALPGLSAARDLGGSLPPAGRRRTRAAALGLQGPRPEPGGLIVRTAAEGAGEDDIARDLRFLQRVWGGVERRAAAAGAPSLVYTEAELAMRSVRDLLGPEFGSVLVDDPRAAPAAGQLSARGGPRSGRPGGAYEGNDVPLFERFGLDAEVKKALRRRVDLPSGGYIVIDHTEAMTVIDVNTGRYVGQAVPGGHHAQDQRRGLPRDRPSAAAAGHRRHHRHRLHRHDRAVQPGGGAGRARGRTGPGSHQDLRGGDIASGAGGDDPAERDPGAARGRDHALPALLRRAAG